MTWHQLATKVMINCEIPSLKDVTITIEEKSFSFKATAGDKSYDMTVPLSNACVVEESRWFGNDRAVSIILTKADSCFWEKLSTDPNHKRIIKPNMINWLEEDDEVRPRATLAAARSRVKRLAPSGRSRKLACADLPLRSGSACVATDRVIRAP
jgi:hypothetical protein